MKNTNANFQPLFRILFPFPEIPRKDETKMSSDVRRLRFAFSYAPGGGRRSETLGSHCATPRKHSMMNRCPEAIAAFVLYEVQYLPCIGGCPFPSEPCEHELLAQHPGGKCHLTIRTRDVVSFTLIISAISNQKSCNIFLSLKANNALFWMESRDP